MRPVIRTVTVTASSDTAGWDEKFRAALAALGIEPNDVLLDPPPSLTYTIVVRD